jgi:hypothetical protein
MAAAVLVVVGLPLGLAACASQQSTSEAEPADSAESTDNVVVLRTGSTEQGIRFGTGGPVAVDSLDDGACVLRHDGHADTLDLPRMDDLPDVGAWTPPPLPFDPDSLARAVQARINPDSIEREALEMRRRADSLAHRHHERADSLRRHFERMQERMEREIPERLREQARRLRNQAERLEERAREMEAPPPPDEPEAPSSGSGPVNDLVREGIS